MNGSETYFKLAVIIPVYNESVMLKTNFLEIKRILDGDDISAQYFFVNDGSRDDTGAVLASLSEEFDCVSYLSFARNFGKEIAISAGLDHIEAQRYLIMDSDLQHPPRYIKTMLKVMDQDKCNVVEGVKASRGKETLKYKLIAKSFYRFLKLITDLEMDNSSDFKLLDRQVVGAIRQCREGHVFFRGIVNWVGFKVSKVPFEVEERKAGTSHFSTGKLVLLALDAILSFTSKPLLLTIINGLIFLLFAVILGAQTLYNYFAHQAVDGFSTVILLLLITGSMIMLSLGIVGVYIARIYDEIKKRPRYVIAEKR